MGRRESFSTTKTCYPLNDDASSTGRRDVHPGTSGANKSARVLVVAQKLGMRNPALRLVGIASSPGGGGVFGNRAEEELRLWLESRLDALGIDPVAYSRFVLSLLRRPNSALSPSLNPGGRRNRVRTRVKLPLQSEREQRRAVVQCLTNAADQKCGVESLVDELCAKLRDLEGGDTNDDKDECRKLEDETKSTTFESLTPRDRALRYYAAFPALQPATPKKTIYKKDKNLATINNNNNNNRTIGVNANANKKNNNKNSINTTSNNKTWHKKTKMSIQAMESRRTNEKECFGFAKSMEREREKERELELDQLRLAQLQAKFDESLEALWDSGPGNSQDKASIWAAPSLSIPSGPLWPVDTGELPLIFPFNDSSSSTTSYQESIIDDSPIIPWDIDFSVDKCTDENAKDKLDYNLNWSDYVGDGPWCWRMSKTLGSSPQKDECFFNFPSCKTPTTIGNETTLHPEVNSLQNVVVVVNADNDDHGDDDDDDDGDDADDDDERDDNDDNDNDGDDNEDLLTSARTHFCPIKDDDNWADGTTFPVNNNFERVAYRRSESGNLLYLPGGESPYMEYRGDNGAPQVPGLTLKFRIRQCDKSIQTDPIRSPIKRRILAEEDHFYYSSVDTDDILTQEVDGVGKGSFVLGQLGWKQPSVSLLNDRKRRHSSSFKCRPLAALRPLTL